MTTTTSTASRTSIAPRSAYADKKLSFFGTVRSEALKFRTLTTNWVMTLIVGVVMIGLALLFAMNLNSQADMLRDNPQMAAEMAAQAGEDGASYFTLDGLVHYAHGLGASGTMLANMLIASIAVVFVASEYATRAIGTTLTVVPRRSMVYVAKFLVVSVFGFITGFVVAALSYFASTPILNEELSSKIDFSSGVVMNWLGVAIYFMLMAWMGLGFGSLLRSNAGGVVLVVVLMFVMQIIFSTLQFDWATDFAPYLPASLGNNITSYGLPEDAKVGYQESGAWLALWAGVPALLGYLRFAFTDAK